MPHERHQEFVPNPRLTRLDEGDTQPYGEYMDPMETTRSLAEQLVRAHVHERTFGSTEVQNVRATIQTDCTDEAAIYVEVTLSEPPERAWPADDTQAIRWRILEVLTSALPGLNFYTKFRVGKPAHA